MTALAPVFVRTSSQRLSSSTSSMSLWTSPWQAHQRYWPMPWGWAAMVGAGGGSSFFSSLATRLLRFDTMAAPGPTRRRVAMHRAKRVAPPRAQAQGWPRGFFGLYQMS